MTTEPEYSMAEFVLKYLNELNAVYAANHGLVEADPEDPIYREFVQQQSADEKMRRGI